MSKYENVNVSNNDTVLVIICEYIACVQIQNTTIIMV